jgi:hypothetical protein
MQNAKPIEEVLNEIGYVLQITPAGRQIWSNPKFILTEGELAEEDELADDGWTDYLREEEDYADAYELSLIED